MQKAHDIMTRAVVTANTDTPVRDVARLMRDLNIGDVLVVNEGKLRGILTDRDIAIKVLTNGANPDAPVEQYMSDNVITGAPDWPLTRVADEMGKHQIRRLPIVQDGALVGIISLGDLAVHLPKQNAVAQSLRSISESSPLHTLNQTQKAIVRVALGTALAGAAIMFVRSRSGERFRKQLEAARLPDRARDIWGDTVDTLRDPATRRAAMDALNSSGIPDRARDFVASGRKTWEDPKTRQRARQLAEQARKQSIDLYESLPNLVHKPKPKRFWLV